MFKKQIQNQEVENPNTIDYKVRVVELESEVEIKDIEVKSLKKKLELKESELSDYDFKTKKQLTEEKNKLAAEIERLRFDASNNTENIELKTQNSKLKSELDVIKSENNHLKTLLKTYQEMPDIKRMIENLSSIAVPNIEELKVFASAVSNNGFVELTKTVKDNTNLLKDLFDSLRYDTYRFGKKF